MESRDRAFNESHISLIAWKGEFWGPYGAIARAREHHARTPESWVSLLLLAKILARAIEHVRKAPASRIRFIQRRRMQRGKRYASRDLAGLHACLMRPVPSCASIALAHLQAECLLGIARVDPEDLPADARRCAYEQAESICASVIAVSADALPAVRARTHALRAKLYAGKRAPGHVRSAREHLALAATHEGAMDDCAQESRVRARICLDIADVYGMLGDREAEASWKARSAGLKGTAHDEQDPPWP